MNRSEFVTAVAQRAGLTQSDTDTMLNALGDVLVEAVGKGEAVKLPGLMTGAKLTAGSKLKAAANGS